MFQESDPCRPPYAVAPFQILHIEETLQVQVIRHGPLDVIKVIPTVKPPLYLPVLPPQARDLPVHIPQFVQEHPLSVQESHLSLYDARCQIVVIHYLPQLRRQQVIMPVRNHPVAPHLVRVQFPVPGIRLPQKRIHRCLRTVRQGKHPPVRHMQRKSMIRNTFYSIHCPYIKYHSERGRQADEESHSPQRTRSPDPCHPERPAGRRDLPVIPSK